jgi:cell division transport system permease protein
VAEVEFFSQQQQYELFKNLFANRPEYIDNVTAANLPTSYRVEPTVADADLIESIGERFERRTASGGAVRGGHRADVLNVSRYAQLGLLGLARVRAARRRAAHLQQHPHGDLSRRQEIEVMKLVGATNLFIRVPFMIEGLLQGLVGAGLAFAAVYFGSTAFVEWVGSFELFNSFVLLTAQVVGTGR